MTLLGKIFTMLIIVMSVLFMGLAICVYATHTNWKELADSYEKQLQDQQRTNDQLRVTLDNSQTQLAAEQAARRQVLSNLQSRVDLLAGDLEDREKSLADEKAKSGLALETLRSNQNTLTRLKDEVDGLRTEITTLLADRDDKFDQVVSLTDRINKTEDLYRRLEETRETLALQVAKMRGVMNKFGIHEDQPTGPIPPPLDGIVVKVGTRRLVYISLGEDDGLRKGHKLDVFRSGNYLGKIEVKETYPDRAVAEIIDDYQRGVIKKDDRVSTKFS